MMQANKANAAEPRHDERLEIEFTVVREKTPAFDEQDEERIEQRRAHQRFKVELDVSVGSDHNFYVGFVENLSMGGVFIATHMLKAVGEVFELTVHLPNSPTAIRGLGEVRWIREYSERTNVPPGMGIRFTRLEPGCQRLIEGFLSERESPFFDGD